MAYTDVKLICTTCECTIHLVLADIADKERVVCPNCGNRLEGESLTALKRLASALTGSEDLLEWQPCLF